MGQKREVVIVGSDAGGTSVDVGPIMAGETTSSGERI